MYRKMWRHSHLDPHYQFIGTLETTRKLLYLVPMSVTDTMRLNTFTTRVQDPPRPLPDQSSQCLESTSRRLLSSIVGSSTRVVNSRSTGFYPTKTSKLLSIRRDSSYAIEITRLPRVGYKAAATFQKTLYKSGLASEFISLVRDACYEVPKDHK